MKSDTNKYNEFIGKCNNQYKNISNKKNGKSCDAKLLNLKIITEYPNKPLTPSGKDGLLVVKIPVVLSEFKIELSCEVNIKLDEPAIEVKRIKKKVYLNQCKLISKTDKLFLSGYIRKNIEYAAVEYKEENIVLGKIKHMIVNVPFECVTKIKYYTQPDIFVKEEQIYDVHILGRSACEQVFEDQEYFNEKIYCELVYAKSTETCIMKEKRKIAKIDKESIIETLREKIDLNLTIRLLQNQIVNIYKGTRL